MRKTVVGVIVGVIVVALVVVAAVSIWMAGRDSSPVATPTKESSPPKLSKFYQQKLHWNDCDGSKCTWIKVPIDYAKPEGKTLRLRVKLKPAEGTSKGHLVINPGGPGGSGVNFVDDFVSRATTLRDDFDIVGFDPRGVGKSTPLKCLSDKSLNHFINLDPDPDTEPEVKAFELGTKKLGEACSRNSGELAAHVSTYEAAEDMDVLRALLGDKKLDYYGASYGTQLGATYAQLFPKKVGRFVLDGAVDPSLSEMQSSFGQAEGFQRALVAYLKNCAKSASCPLGQDPVAAEKTLGDFIQGLDAKPLKVGDRKLTEAMGTFAVALPLYNRAYWPLLTKALTAASHGNGVLLLSLADQYFSRQPDGSFSDNSSEVIYAVQCLDERSTLTPEDARKAEPKFVKASPVFGRFMAWGAIGCSDWPIKVTHPQVKISAKGAAPIVVIGTTRDPATPYEWAESLAKQLDSGVLVTRDGDGHTGFGVGNSCIDKTVDRYLTDGDVPKDGTVCQAG